MNKRFSGLIAFILLIIAVWLHFNFDQPDFNKEESASLTEFSTSRAFEHVKALGQRPHYVGSPAHSLVRNYIVDQLQKMGLEVQTQEGYDLNSSGVLVRPQNILSRIEGDGEGNAIVLMTHYDSAMHSSYGAADAGSGVATILEGIRAFLEKNADHKNDIILLFTDAEELGLNGANLFIKEHPWAKDAQLAMNFEARGSGGNSIMLLETNGKNARLIEAFKKADPAYPVSNSLAYSIYKMLPNDTDLTVMREQGDINGYNFAFIDNHFIYHTALDIPDNLELNTLKQQGGYLMSLLAYLSNAELTKLSSDRDLIFFNFPFGQFFTYPFDWIYPMLILAGLLFLVLVIYGIRRESLSITGIFTGFLPAILGLILSGVLTWAFWQFCLFIYPEYSEMEQGFTYNGYWYIAIAIFLALSISFFIYHAFRKKAKAPALFIAPLFIWLVICALIASYLPGASYFIIPVYFGLLQLFIMIRLERPNRIIMALLCYPSIFILTTFLWTLPVALGLKMLFLTSILTVLLFYFALPVFGYFRRLKSFGILCFLIFNILLIIAHFNSDFNTKRPKPNSLVYLKDLDTDGANWYSYDKMPDEWLSQFFGEDPALRSSTEANFSSKYSSRFTYSSDAPEASIPEPSIMIEKLDEDSLQYPKYSIKIAPRRKINRIEIFEYNDIDFQSFEVNGLEAEDLYLGENPFHMFTRRYKERLLTYYASSQDTLRIEFSIKPSDKPEFVIYESAYDLFDNKHIKVPERHDGMIPKPFVLNDATILKKTFSIE